MALLGGTIDGLQYELRTTQTHAPDSVDVTLVLSEAATVNRATLPAFVKHLGQAKNAREIELTFGAAAQTTGTLGVFIEREEVVLPVLSGPVYLAVEHVLNGRVTEARAILERQYSASQLAWQFRNDCRTALSFDTYVRVLDVLAGAADEFAYVQFRSRIGYFANRIGGHDHQGIHSVDVLEERIETWNQMEHLDPVDLSDVLSEHLCKQWFSEGFGRERETLQRIGFDPTTFDPEWNTTLPASWIAHLVATDSITAAEAYARERPIPTRSPYKTVKAKAFGRAFGERGPAWGAVVALAADPRIDDFRFDAYQYVRWTAEEYRGKGKIPPLLYAAARQLAPPHVPDSQRQWLAFNEKMSIGHAWRRDNAVEQACTAFETALAIARGETKSEYSFTPELVVEATASGAHVRAKTIGGGAVARREYDAAIRAIQRLGEEYDLDPRLVERQVAFLSEERPPA